MKGFPNQIIDFPKLSLAMKVVVDLLRSGKNPKDDAVFGPALVRAGVIGTKRSPIESYIKQQLAKKPDRRSFGATSRGLRELFGHLGFISDDGAIHITEAGSKAADLATEPLEVDAKDFWRRSIRNLSHFGADPTASHPYQVLLRLVGERPGIVRAKCALALEAKDDSDTELLRIAKLSDLEEKNVRRRIAVTKSTWDNAKKVFPAFAEQLGDIVKVKGRMYLGANLVSGPTPVSRKRAERTRRSPRRVTSATIATAGTSEVFDDVELPTTVDAQALADAINRRRHRLRRHNLLVKELSKKLKKRTQYENPFDLLALTTDVAYLIEVKTLDGTEIDEDHRVRGAFSQLHYYEHFSVAGLIGKRRLQKIACLEGPISSKLAAWLNSAGIGVVWKDGDQFRSDELGIKLLKQFD